MKHILIPIAVLTTCGGLMALSQSDPAAPSATQMKDLHQAVMMYSVDYDDLLPMMSSPSTQSPRTRWPDALWPYLNRAEVFSSPLAPAEMRTRTFAHAEEDPTLPKWGGYGYNYQYLGNSRSQEGNKNLPFGRPYAEITEPGRTVLLAETQGVRFDDGKLSTGVYTVDPPLPSARGAGNASGFYASGDACGTGPQGCRSAPAEWIPNRVVFVTISGEFPFKSRAKLDDLNLDGTLDNGWWNGTGNVSKR
jgi:hypothetical protein